jgi:hypothetical protein
MEPNFGISFRLFSRSGGGIAGLGFGGGGFVHDTYPF